MEVTRANFKEVLEKLPDVVKNAQFVAIDTEFTGLRVEGASHLNYYDTLEDLYVKDRLTVEKFLVIQYGIVIFHYDEEKNRYTHQGYNFYVYPSKLCPNVNFTCQASSIEFLIQHNFDFNKLFSDGIPYLRDNEADKLIEKIEDSYEKKMTAESTPTAEIPIPDEHKSTINDIIRKIEESIKSKKSNTFVTEKYNSFVRRLIYNNTQDRFGSSVLLQTNKDQTITIMTGLTKEERKNLQNKSFSNEKQNVLDNVGFCNVIKLLTESGKLIVGHNFFLDLLFTIKQFVQPLPNSYKQFKELAHFLFPKVVDTKYMSSLNEFKNLKCSTLYELKQQLEKNVGIPEIDISENGIGYKLNDEKLHEAAYDAFITGACFLSMSNHIGKLNMTDIFKNLQNSVLLQPIMNKLYVPRLHDIPYMNIGGFDAEPDRLNVFHLSFPKDWKRDDILSLFKECGFIRLAWINDTSSYIGVKKEYYSKVKQLMKPNEKYSIRTYDEFRSSQKAINETEEDSFSPPKVLNDSKNENSFNSSKNGSSSSFARGENKRTQDEDLGEVIERPQKKLRAFEEPPFE